MSVLGAPHHSVSKPTLILTEGSMSLLPGEGWPGRRCRLEAGTDLRSGCNLILRVALPAARQGQRRMLLQQGQRRMLLKAGAHLI